MGAQFTPQAARTAIADAQAIADHSQVGPVISTRKRGGRIAPAVGSEPWRGCGVPTARFWSLNTLLSPSVPELLAYPHVIRDRLNAPCIDVPFHDEEDAPLNPALL